MNEKLNLVEILKDCPKGTKLYSTNFGVVKFDEIGNNPNYPKKHPSFIDIGRIDYAYY